MHVRNRFFHCPRQREISIAGVTGVDAALHANFGGAALPGFMHSPLHFIEFEIVRFTAQILACLAFGERAKLAAKITNVRVVDVARDDVTHGGRINFRAQAVRAIADPVEVRPAGLK